MHKIAQQSSLSSSICITSNKIAAIYCPTKNMIADMLTKPLDGPKLAKHARLICLTK